MTTAYHVPLTTGLDASKIAVTDANKNLISGTNTGAQVAAAISASHTAATVKGAPLSISSQQISFDYNTTNLKITTDKLNTIQDIATGSTPTFAGVVVADGGTIGQTAGPLLTFDDANNKLTISGCQTGFGTIISNWDSSIFKSVDIGGGGHHLSFAAQVNGAPSLELTADAYYNAGWKHSTSGGAARYSLAPQAGGAPFHFWQMASSGTVGGPIIWTTGLAILESGYVGINTIVPQHTCQIYGTLKVGGSAAQTTGTIALGDDESTGLYNGIFRGTSTGGLGGGNWCCIGGYDGVNIVTGNAFFGSQTLRVTIDANGITAASKVRANTAFNLNGTDGASGSFTAGTQTVTVTGGIITSIV